MRADYTWNFSDLEAARNRRGDPPEGACVALKISRATWDLWKSKGTFRTQQGTDARIRRYLKAKK